MAFKTKVKKRDLDAENGIINGSLDNNQRGVSTGPATNVYSADRMFVSIQGLTTGASTHTTGIVHSSESLLHAPNLTQRIIVERDSGQTWTNTLYLTYIQEKIYSERFKGKDVVVSFLANKNTGFTGVDGKMEFQFEHHSESGEVGVQSAFTNGTSYNHNIVLTDELKLYWFTYKMPDDLSQFRLNFKHTPVGTAPAYDSFILAGLMIHEGVEPIPFNRAGGSRNAEFMLCQRYYLHQFKFSGGLAYNNAGVVSGAANAPVKLRRTPSILGTFIMKTENAPAWFRSAGANVNLYTNGIGLHFYYYTTADEFGTQYYGVSVTTTVNLDAEL